MIVSIMLLDLSADIRGAEMETPVRDKTERTRADEDGFTHDEIAVVSDWFSEDRGRWAEDTRAEHSDTYNAYIADPGTKGAL